MAGWRRQPPEQLGGVQGTLSTYLEFFLNPENSSVFCANEPTFSVSQIDAGKIVCLAMPQKFQSERLYINTILKPSYYFHALSRFDKSAEEREKDNLVILFADEGQEIIAAGQPGREILHPVAVVIFSGIFSSTLLDFIVTPLVFWRFGRKSVARLLPQAVTGPQWGNFFSCHTFLGWVTWFQKKLMDIFLLHLEHTAANDQLWKRRSGRVDSQCDGMV